LGDFIGCFVIRNCQEERIYHAVRVTFATLTDEPAVGESRMEQHFPDVRISPIVWFSLRENLDSEIVVATL
jgi:hypothetical protein